MHLVLLAGMLVVANTATVRGQSLPSSYDEFVSVDDYASVNEAIANEQYLYFPSPSGEIRTFEIDNPIVIDRDGPLVMHGTFRKTTLVPKYPQEPLFIVKRAGFLNIHGFLIDYTTPDQQLYLKGMVFENTQPLRAELNLVSFLRASLDINGPGTFVFQRSTSRMMSFVQAGISIDHPQAAVYCISSGGLNASGLPKFDSPDIYWIWCKRGHLETYGTFPSGFTRGRADIRIDSPSFKGAHILAYNRCEGTKALYGPSGKYARDTLLYVPKSDQKVNVVLKANRAAANQPNIPMVDYNAAGTVWMFNNNMEHGTAMYSEKELQNVDNRRTFLIQGDAPDATIVALGNNSCSEEALSQISAGTKYAAGNLFNSKDVYKVLRETDRATFVKNDGMRFATGESASLAGIPMPPKSGDIPAVVMPAVNEPLNPVLRLNSVKDFGAKGDGQTDDTAAIQQALDEHGNRLFFPAGTYLITQTLKIDDFWTRFPAGGGWIAGAGSDKVRIKKSNGGSVVQATGLVWYTIQGITFETTDQSGICFALDRDEKAYTSGDFFYDCAFIGGRIAFGATVIKGPNCEIIYFLECSFEEAGVGYTSRDPNALKNMFHRCRFVNNNIHLGFETPELQSKLRGCFGILSAELKGAKLMDFGLNLNKARFFMNIKSDGPRICDGPTPSVFYDMPMFENCQWTALSEDAYTHGVSGVVTFLNSKLNGGKLLLTPPSYGRTSVLNLWSDIPSWEASAATSSADNVRYIKVQ